MSPAAFLSHGTGVRIPVPVPKIPNPEPPNPKIQIQTPDAWHRRLDELSGHDPDGDVHTQRIALSPIGVKVVQVVAFPLPAV